MFVELVVTIVVLLILAGITIIYVMGDNNVFKQAQNAKLQTEIAKAREKLEITFGHAKLLKHTDNKYDQDDYLDDLMEKEIPSIDIEDDIVIVDGYAFDIDRSEPKIGEYRGEKKDLAFPEVTITIPVISEDAKTATFTINASESTKGISRIEIWLSGEKIDTISYDAPKKETTENYSVNRNGVYKVKAYADLVGSEKVMVEGLIPVVEFSPNGSTEWKKEHSTKIMIKETAGTITEMKYVWTNSVQEPTKFTETCTNNSTITGKGYTGKYYLWIWFKTSENKTNVCGSDEFYFDNKGPEISYTVQYVNANSFRISASCEDKHSNNISEMKLKRDETEISDTQEAILTYTEKANEVEKNFTITAKDDLGNENSQQLDIISNLYVWKEYDTVVTSTTWSQADWITEYDNDLEPQSQYFTSFYPYESYTVTKNGEPINSGKKYDNSLTFRGMYQQTNLYYKISYEQNGKKYLYRFTLSANGSYPDYYNCHYKQEKKEFTKKEVRERGDYLRNVLGKEKNTYTDGLNNTKWYEKLIK